MKLIRILLIGDEAVGKTSIIERYINDTFLITHSPTVVNEYVKYMKNYQLHIRDSSALNEFKSIRIMQYCQVDIILFCFNMASFTSLDNLTQHWLQEVNEHCKSAIRILIGCKNDLDSIINEVLVIKMQEQLKVTKYVKCSAKANENVDAVFNAALNAYLVGNSGKFGKDKKGQQQKKRFTL